MELIMELNEPSKIVKNEIQCFLGIKSNKNKETERNSKNNKCTNKSEHFLK